QTSRSKSRFCGGLELVSALPPLKHASPFLRKNAFLNGCFKGIGADEIKVSSGLMFWVRVTLKTLKTKIV
ncbi:MAG: hypothetical protein Q4G42_09060, partial [Neisseria sp.]|nr:hypothetical protein [Neisseria sp.]